MRKRATPSKSKPAEPLAESSLVYVGPNGIPVMRCRENAPACRATIQELLDLERQIFDEADLLYVGLCVTPKPG